MQLKALGIALGSSLVFISSAMLAAPGQTARPGEMTPANVWVQNRNRNEMIPISLQEAATDVVVRVQVANFPPGLSGASIATHPVRQGWEYQQISIAAGQDALGALTAAGNDGWETTGLQFPSRTGTVIVLKRPR